MIVLPSGHDGVRFRPALTVSRAEIEAALCAIRAALRDLS
jgi:L-lysine 6-transaminase